MKMGLTLPFSRPSDIIWVQYPPGLYARAERQEGKE